MMSTTSAAIGPESAGIECGDLRPRGQFVRERVRGRTVGAIGLVLLGGLILAGAGVGPLGATVAETPSLSVSAEPAVPGNVAVMPSAPVDGVLTMVIPPGAAADQRAGGRGYQMPDVIQLTSGDTVVLRNDDTEPHMILYAFLMPGETHERTLITPGSEVYSSGCGVHGASILNFTTIFVSE
jgi:hypothetical protein